MKEIKKDDIIEFLEKLPKKKVEGKTFEEWLMYENRSLWWYVRIPLLFEHVPNLMSFHKTCKRIKSKKPLFLYSLLIRVFLFFFKNFLLLNELMKCLIGRKSKNTTKLLKDKKTIAFFAHTNGLLQNNNEFAVDRVEPLRQLFNNHKQFQTYISSVESFSRRSFFNLRKFPNPIYKFFEWKLFFDSWKEARKMAKIAKRIICKLEFSSLNQEKTFYYLKPTIRFFFSQQYILITLLYYKMYSKLFQSHKFDFVFFYSTGDIFSRACISAADKHKVLLGGINHGAGLALINPEMPNSFHYFLSGETFQQKLTSLGVPKENIHVSGALFLSEIVPFLSVKKTQKIKHKILFITSTFVESNNISEQEYFELIKKLFNFFKSFPTIQFIHKMHSGERYKKKYLQIKENLQTKNLVINNSKTKEELYQLITDSDLILSFGSTVDVEALILDKPVIILDFIDTKSAFYYTPTYAPVFRLRTTSMDTLRKTIYEILAGKKLAYNNSDEFIVSHFFKINDEISKNIFNFIKTKI